MTYSSATLKKKENDRSERSVLHTIGLLAIRLSRSDEFSTGSVLGLLFGPAVFVAVRVMPLGLTAEQHTLAAIIAMTISFWVLKVFPLALSAILALALSTIFGVAPVEQVFGAFSSPALFLLIGSFLLTLSMSVHKVGDRIAVMVLSLPFVMHSRHRVVIAFGAIAALLSTVLDNGAVAAILLPIALGLVENFRSEKSEDHGDRFAVSLLLITAYGSTVGALLTPLGDASNIVGWRFMQEQTDETLSLGLWMLMAAPITIVLFCVLCVIVLVLNPPGDGDIEAARKTIAKKRAALGPMTTGEKNTLVIFLGAVALWVLPSIAGFIAGQESDAYEFLTTRLPPSVVAILAAAMLFVAPSGWNEGFTLSWSDTSKLNWGPIFLVGATLALGSLMASTGLAGELGARLANSAEDFNAAGVYFFAAAIATMFSELSTNLVSVTVIVPLIPSVAEASGGDTLQATWIATFAAIYGFMLPISTSANAIIYGSGRVPMSKMIRTGAVVDISGVILVVTGVSVMVRVLNIG